MLKCKAAKDAGVEFLAERSRGWINNFDPVQVAPHKIKTKISDNKSMPKATASRV
jgi:hypothetical protein